MTTTNIAYAADSAITATNWESLAVDARLRVVEGKVEQIDILANEIAQRRIEAACSGMP